MTRPDLDPPAGALAQRPWLLADIGGTNARFGWLAEGDGPVREPRSLRVRDFADPAAAARAYLDGLAATLGAAYRPPRAAAFAVATAVGGDRVDLTNSGWQFSRRATCAALGLERFVVVNDFEALALSLPRLAPTQLERIASPADPVPSCATGARAVIGPGTGLGVAGLVRAGARWVAIPGEGGHATLAPADEFESALLAAVRREFTHVSAERLLSGIGLPVLHRGTAAVLGVPATPIGAEAVVERGLAGTDPVARRALELFCALLGSFAGNVALTFGARGGVYLGGGIVPRLGAFFGASRFRERFEAKGRFAGYLRAIPTWLVTDTLAALAGAAQALEQSTAQAEDTAE